MSGTPNKAHKADAGYDISAVSYEFDKYGNIVYHTGLAVEIPFGFVGKLYCRSSIAKYDLILTNGVGIIDSGYTGEITMKFKPTERFIKRGEGMEPIVMRQPKIYNIGDRIGQLIIEPITEIEFTETDTLNESERGNGGYGSTGK